MSDTPTVEPNSSSTGGRISVRNPAASARIAMSLSRSLDAEGMATTTVVTPSRSASSTIAVRSPHTRTCLMRRFFRSALSSRIATGWKGPDLSIAVTTCSPPSPAPITMTGSRSSPSARVHRSSKRRHPMRPAHMIATERKPEMIVALTGMARSSSGVRFSTVITTVTPKATRKAAATSSKVP